MDYVVLDYAESIIELITILVTLLISLFRFINTNNRRWLYLVMFFLATLLSSYFWTSYLIIMGETPEVNDLFAYFGWNLAFFIMVVFLVKIKDKDELKYFHPVMLIPIPLNILQFLLYIHYGAILNNAYQVLMMTAVACLSLQSIMWYLKNRTADTAPPYIAYATLFFSFAEFGKWTFSSLGGFFEDLYILYYPYSFLTSATYFIIAWATGQSIKNAGNYRVYVGKKIQNILKITYTAIATACSFGGVLLGMWIRKVLVSGLSGDSNTSVFDIITVILFLISVVIAASAVVVVYIIYFVQKVSENERLKEERRIADQSNAAKSQFLAQMSHEIRTPLNAVLGMNEMILHESKHMRDYLPDKKDVIREKFDDIAGYAENINSAGNNLLSIINDILDISKIEAGKLEIRNADYELSSVINGMVSIISSRAQSKGLEFIVEADEDLPDVLYGDEVRVRQIILNILNNAVKYTPEGSVTFSISARDPHTFEKGQTIDLIIRVRDTGIGIREDDIGKLFNRFERMDMKQNSGIEGTGLGLAITKQLVEMMNGDVSVQSRYGEGSEFTVFIPQTIVSTTPIGDFHIKAKEIAEKESEDDVLFTAPDARILVVDDTRLNLIVAMGLLKDTKIRTDLSGSGKGALNMMSKVNYDLVLLDQRMPEMDGIETLRHIRNREGDSGKHVPVICLTADAIEGARQRYIDEGFTDYLTKPIDGASLKKMVKKYLPKEKINLL